MTHPGLPGPGPAPVWIAWLARPRYLVAEVHALRADRHAARTGDQHLDLILPLIAETAFQVVAIHRRPPLIVTGHHYQPRRTDNPGYAGKRPTCDDEHQGDDAGHALRPGATLGATGANNLPRLRTYLNNERRRARGHGLMNGSGHSHMELRTKRSSVTSAPWIWRGRHRSRTLAASQG